MRKNRRRWLSWALGAALLAFILFHVSRSPQWRSFDWQRLETLLVHVNRGELILAVLLSYLTYLVRAYRWEYFVEPLKKCSPWTLFKAQVIGFSAIYLVGRAGEVVRPAYIARLERVSFTSQVAVWMVERIYDSFALVVLFALSLRFISEPAAAANHPALMHRLHEGAIAILALSGVAVVCLAAYRLYSRRVIASLLRFIPRRVRGHAAAILESFSAGLAVIQNPWDFTLTVALTVVVWAINVTVLWLTIRCVGGGMAAFGWWDAGLTAFLGAIGLLIQLPGVGGGYQVAVLLSLKDIFHLPPEGSAGAAILAWVTVMLPCIALGLVMLITGRVSMRKLRVATEEQKHQLASPEP